MFGRNGFEFPKGNLKEENNHGEENNFSEEFKLKSEEFKEELQNLGSEIKNLVEALSSVRIPYNSYDKKNIGNPEASYLEDTSFDKKLDNLNICLDNINSNEGDSISQIKNYNDIKEKINYIYDRFNSTGYLSDRGKGGDVLKIDFPEIAAKIDSIMAKISEINKITVSLDNRLGAQGMLKKMDNKRLSSWDKYISKIAYVSKSGKIGFYSLEIGTFHTPKELVENLEKFLDNDLKNSIDEVQKNEKFSEEEKNERMDTLQGLMIGGREYLDEFKKLMESKE